jgi:hypothetical protein
MAQFFLVERHPEFEPGEADAGRNRFLSSLVYSPRSFIYPHSLLL